MSAASWIVRETKFGFVHLSDRGMFVDLLLSASGFRLYCFLGWKEALFNLTKVSVPVVALRP